MGAHATGASSFARGRESLLARLRAAAHEKSLASLKIEARLFLFPLLML
jgi:hypothetical protein